MVIRADTELSTPGYCYCDANCFIASQQHYCSLHPLVELCLLYNASTGFLDLQAAAMIPWWATFMYKVWEMIALRGKPRAWADLLPGCFSQEYEIWKVPTWALGNMYMHRAFHLQLKLRLRDPYGKETCQAQQNLNQRLCMILALKPHMTLLYLAGLESERKFQRHWHASLLQSGSCKTDHGKETWFKEERIVRKILVGIGHLKGNCLWKCNHLTNIVFGARSSVLVTHFCFIVMANNKNFKQISIFTDFKSHWRMGTVPSLTFTTFWCLHEMHRCFLLLAMCLCWLCVQTKWAGRPQDGHCLQWSMEHVFRPRPCSQDSNGREFTLTFTTALKMGIGD